MKPSKKGPLVVFIDEAICPACGRKESRHVYEKLRELGALLECAGCGLCFIWPDPGGGSLEQIYDKNYYDRWSLDDLGPKGLSRMKQATFDYLFDIVAKYGKRGKLLDIGCAFGDLLNAAARRGWMCHGIEISSYAAGEAGKKLGPENIREGDFLKSAYPPETFNAVTMVDMAEHIYETRALFQKCHDILKENGLLIIVTPDINSLSRKAMGQSWPHFNREHIVYFSGNSIARILSANGFELLEAASFKKALNLYYIIAQLSMAEKAAPLRYLAKILSVLLPGSVKSKNFFAHHGEMLIISRKRSVLLKG